jgi:hypothetical protein
VILFAGPLIAQRRTVFVLVDESGSLKSDRAGWRKQAASLLAYSLSDGSSMSLSGFGNAGRTLELSPSLLDYTPLGTRHRQALAQTAAGLTDSDNQTDLFGAIHAVLVEISKMDPALRKSAPPALVVLSDFRPDPSPDAKSQHRLCEELGTSHVDLVEVGFGGLDRKVSDYLAACAGTTLWGSVSDPAALPEIFWKLQSRFSRSLKIFDEAAHAGEIRIPTPEWAEELLVLGLNTTVGSTTGDWTWSGADLVNIQQGERYRLGRIADLRNDQKTGQTSLQLAGSVKGLRLLAVARGAIELRVTGQPQPPWYRSEIIAISANLISSRSGKPVTEWQTAGAAQYAADLKIAGGDSAALRLDTAQNSFKGTVTIPAVPKLSADATVSIDGATWSDQLSGSVSPMPVELGLDGQGRLAVRTWSFGVPVNEKIRSSIPNREFDVTVSAAGPVEVNPDTMHFNASTTAASITIRAKRGPIDKGPLVFWFEDEPGRVASLTLTTHLKSGQVIASGPVPVVVELQPLWKRVAVAIGAILTVLICLIVLIRGRALPKWLLVPSDASGNPVRGADPVRLSAYRRSLDLKSYGMPGAVLYRSMGGRVGVRLRPGVQLQPAGTSIPFQPADRNIDSPVGLGDRLHYRRPDGTSFTYKIDAF